ncbi:unnamed protein product, partial [Hapterophycus canaliculatus]
QDHNSDRTTRGYVLTALTKLAGRLGEDQEEAIESLLQTYSASMNLELQARSCEFGQLLRPDLVELRKGMLDRMPVADEETVRNRRARFRNDDNGDGGGSDDDDDEDRGLPSFKISKASKQRRGSSSSAGGGAAGAATAALPGGKAVQPLAGPGSAPGAGVSKQKQQEVPNLLDLDDLFGGGGGDAGAAPPAGVGKATAVDLMADIFSAPLAAAPAASTAALDPFAPAPALLAGGVGKGGALGLPPATAATVAGDSNGAGGFGGTTSAAGAAGPGGGAAPMAAAKTALPPLSFVAFEKDGLAVVFELSKPSPSEDPSTTHIKATFRNSGEG